jgi:DNA-binding MarR family transcriptional regulator
MAEWIAVLFDFIIHKYGGETTLNEFRVMNQIIICYLQGSSPCTFRCLVSKIPVKRSTISRAVTRLVQRECVREEIDPRDRRRRLIYVTESFAADVRGHFKLLRVALPEES